MIRPNNPQICAICSRPIYAPDSEVDPDTRRCFCDAIDTVLADSPESLQSSDYTISSSSEEGSFTIQSETTEDTSSPKPSDVPVTSLNELVPNFANKNNDAVKIGEACSYDVNDVNVDALFSSDVNEVNVGASDSYDVNDFNVDALFSSDVNEVNVGASCSYDVNDVNVGASCSYDVNDVTTKDTSSPNSSDVPVTSLNEHIPNSGNKNNDAVKIGESCSYDANDVNVDAFFSYDVNDVNVGTSCSDDINDVTTEDTSSPKPSDVLVPSLNEHISNSGNRNNDAVKIGESCSYDVNDVNVSSSCSYDVDNVNVDASCSYDVNDVNVGASCSYDINDANVGTSCSYDVNRENLDESFYSLSNRSITTPSLKTKTADSSFTLNPHTGKRLFSEKCINLDKLKANQGGINISDDQSVPNDGLSFKNLDEHSVPNDVLSINTSDEQSASNDGLPLSSQALDKLHSNACKTSPNKVSKSNEVKQLIENIKVRTDLALAAAALNNVDKNVESRQAKENKENIPSRSLRPPPHPSKYNPKKNYKQILDHLEYFRRLRSHTKCTNQAQMIDQDELERQQAFDRAQRQEASRARNEALRRHEEAYQARHEALQVRHQGIKARREATLARRAERRQSHQIQQDINRLRENIFESQRIILPRIRTRTVDVRSMIKRQLSEQNFKKDEKVKKRKTDEQNGKKK